MKTETYDLEFITPAFLCGADQKAAELRAASVRGALRWWFRILGGKKDEETQVFGGVQGGAVKSRVQVRCVLTKPVHEAFSPPPSMSNLGYLYYFATVSGDKKGVRIGRNAYFAPGTEFTVQIGDCGMPEELAELFWRAVEAFMRLGALGLRATRGCGAFAQNGDLLSKEVFLRWAESFPSDCGTVRLVSEVVFSRADKAQTCLGGWLRDLRRNEHQSGKDKTAFGYSIGSERMSSALKLRPVKVKEGFLAVAFYSDGACTCPSLWALI